MNEKITYPIVGIRERSVYAQSGICPDCGAHLVRCDGRVMHQAATGQPAWQCEHEGCPYVCIY